MDFRSIQHNGRRISPIHTNAQNAAHTIARFEIHRLQRRFQVRTIPIDSSFQHHEQWKWISLFFSVKTFNAVLNLCSELEIRHPEELSLCKPLEIEHLKYNYSQVKRAEEKRRRVTLGSMPNRSTSASSHDLDRTIVVDRPDTNTFIANRYVCVFKLHCIHRIFTYVFFGLFSIEAFTYWCFMAKTPTTKSTFLEPPFSTL